MRCGRCKEVFDASANMLPDVRFAPVAKPAAPVETPASTVATAAVVAAPKPKASSSWKILGLSSDRAVIVNAKGEQIVVSAGVHSLKEGMSVELLKPVSKTNIGKLL